MEIYVSQLNYSATKWEVKRAFADVLHREPWYRPDDHKARPINFDVEFRNPGPGSLPNDGTAVLILPDRALGRAFFRWAIRPENRIRIRGRKVYLQEGDKPPRRRTIQVLHKTPFIDPTIEEEREARNYRIGQIGIVIDAIQFGVYFRRPDDPPTANRVFANEYEIRRMDTFSGRLCLDYDHKMMRIEMGNCVTDKTSEHIVIDLSNIKKIGYGTIEAGNYYICFELYCPPRFERQDMYRSYTGEGWKDGKGFRERLPHLDKLHQAVGRYAFQLRLLLNHEVRSKSLKALCEEAGIKPPSKVKIDVENCGFFRPEVMRTVQEWICGFSWPVAFQLEALLRNGLLHTGHLHELRGEIEGLHEEDADFTADVLRHFSEKLRSKHRDETVVDCFRNTLADARNTLANEQDEENSLSAEQPAILVLKPESKVKPESKGTIKCYHVIVTPTRELLEGPYDTQSNRVVRRYYDYRENFVRVEFRDENKMEFRWPKEVSGRSLIEQRFGSILKQGIEIAGRRFRFLGYSNSGLGAHTTWFMSDFEHPEEGLVTPNKIRNDLGNFEDVNTIPSKYAARIAQAFSATDPSVRIRRDQWDADLKDLGTEKYEHTDGQGTISPALRDIIWEALVKAQPDLSKLTLKPSAYQIRFLGFKGMVVVDETLEGVYMRMRPSMRKFEAHDHDKSEAEIEIAKAFVYPGTARLCRPLIMVLEDLGVRKEAFLTLQERAKAAVVTASDTMATTIELLRKHNLGNTFGLRWILQHLQKAGMGMPREGEQRVMDNPFILRLVKYAQSHILREIKHKAAIPIPKAHQLVGVADEGPEYVEMRKMENVFCLKENEIFGEVIAIQNHSAECTERLILMTVGQVSISRSPHIHPGDVQRVKAVGKPPDDKICFFRNLRNVVVLPSVGKSSLASCLAGGDVDGRADEFLVIKDPTLLPTIRADPAKYEGCKPRRLDRPSTVDDICDFFVEYMQSDVIGLLADLHLKIADQSQYGTFDKDCLKLAILCSQAVDYPKNGVPVDRENLPHPLIRANPDWKKAEDNDPRPSDYYESTRALGALFRNIEIKPVQPPSSSYPNGTPDMPTLALPLSDSISRALLPAVTRYLGAEHARHGADDKAVAALSPLFRYYADELRFLCLTHALSDRTDVRLSEEEVAIGTILAKCDQPRWRQNRMHRMREHAGQLVRHVKHARLRAPLAKDAREDELVGALRRAWLAWDYGMRNQSVFGARSFSLIALGVVCDVLEKLAKLDSQSEDGDVPEDRGQDGCEEGADCDWE
ncbi:RdRP-domain-containing protein [Trametes coccinea BRFM310]|uniref:RNA-dependent RNA polymerase n=1 Tax=Trametes coccinea (strain BRFM310) TaxID=1353009 RepID=A0A1Y2J171_TRAC3|nr:RdRP-domain-containing protein [Trametes coccinea BRFM310]